MNLDKCPICGKTDTLRIMEGDRVWIECMDGEVRMVPGHGREGAEQ